MRSMGGTIETSGALLPEEDKVSKAEAGEARNERLEALSDHIDYAAKMEMVRAHMLDVEMGKFEFKGEYDLFDEQIKVKFMGDPRSSFIIFENDSPALHVLEKELGDLGYVMRKQGEMKTVFSKIFMDRAPSHL